MPKLLRAAAYAISVLLISSAATPHLFAESKFAGKKILHVDSYHAGYAWSDGIARGIAAVLVGRPVELKTFHMDTKRHTSREFKEKAALKAKAVIEEFKPDVVIASDDNASKYLVMPYYKDAKLPFVFCGVNWDASAYGYPYENATGMIEVDFSPMVIADLKRYAKNSAVGFVAGDTEVSRKIGAYYNKKLYAGKMKEYYVKTFDEFKEAFPKIQNEVGVILFENTAAVKKWDQPAVEEFIIANTRIPTAAITVGEARFAMVSLAELPEEQGVWAATTALKILSGTPPSDIPLAKNKRERWIVNLSIAELLGLALDPTLLEKAEIIRPVKRSEK